MVVDIELLWYLNKLMYKMRRFAITGSSRSLTEQMFLARFPHVHLVAENGVAIYSRDKQDPERKVWHETTQTPVEESSTWQIIKERGTEIMKDYQWRVNGSEVHEFESVLSWDHRNSDPEWAEAQARFLANDLEDMLGELYLEMAKVRILLSLTYIPSLLCSLRTLLRSLFESHVWRFAFVQPVKGT